MTTTIKVPVELRDRINREAQERGLTAAGLVEKLLDGYERRRRMEAFGRAFRCADQDYRDEFREWDVALGDGQDGHRPPASARGVGPTRSRAGGSRPDTGPRS